MAHQQEILSRLWDLVLNPNWATPQSLREAIKETARLVASLGKEAAPRARHDAILMGRALERIGRGVWPCSPQIRAFLGDCIRAVALRSGISPFWGEAAVAELHPETTETSAPPQAEEAPTAAVPEEATAEGIEEAVIETVEETTAERIEEAAAEAVDEYEEPAPPAVEPPPPAPPGEPSPPAPPVEAREPAAVDAGTVSASLKIAREAAPPLPEEEPLLLVLVDEPAD